MEAFRQDGFKFIIYPNDHNPPHVHIIKAAAEAVIYLGSEDEPPSFRENKSMRPKDALKAFKICCERQKELLDEWRNTHG